MSVTGVAVAVQAVGGTSDVAAADEQVGTLPTAGAGDAVSRSSARIPLSDQTSEIAEQAEHGVKVLEKEQAAREKEKREKAERRAAIEDAREDPRGAAKAMLADFGWGADQFPCLDALWTRESGWNYQAENPSSGAYGIPQSLPGSKMGTIADDWQTNPLTQIRWGLTYIEGSYGSPCGADSHSQDVGHY